MLASIRQSLFLMLASMVQSCMLQHLVCSLVVTHLPVIPTLDNTLFDRQTLTAKVCSLRMLELSSQVPKYNNIHLLVRNIHN